MCAINIVSKQFYDVNKTRGEFYSIVQAVAALDSTQNWAAYNSSDFM